MVIHCACLWGMPAFAGMTVMRMVAAEFQAFVETIILRATDLRYTSDGQVFVVDHQTRTIVVVSDRGESTAYRPDFRDGWEYHLSEIIPKR